MHHAIGAVGTVKRGSGSQNDFDALNVVTGQGDQIIGVEAQRWDAGNAVVNECEQCARKYLVESANDHAALRYACLSIVNAGQSLDIFTHGQDFSVSDFRGIDY